MLLSELEAAIKAARAKGASDDTPVFIGVCDDTGETTGNESGDNKFKHHRTKLTHLCRGTLVVSLEEENVCASEEQGDLTLWIEDRSFSAASSEDVLHEDPAPEHGPRRWPTMPWND